jgi:hypothetical protein
LGGVIVHNKAMEYVCVFITTGPSTKLFARAGGYWRTLAYILDIGGHWHISWILEDIGIYLGYWRTLAYIISCVWSVEPVDKKPKRQHAIVLLQLVYYFNGRIALSKGCDPINTRHSQGSTSICVVLILVDSHADDAPYEPHVSLQLLKATFHSSTFSQTQAFSSHCLARPAPLE